MSAADLLPAYFDVSRSERGNSFGIDSETYRMLAATALSVTQGVPNTFMGIYGLGDGRGCVLDIFVRDFCLTVVVDSSLGQISLLCSDLDSPASSGVLLDGIESCPENWRKLGAKAKEIIRE